MQDLINQLNNGTTEYKDGGEIRQNPPTALAKRAANTIAQLANINADNQRIMMELQNRVNQQLEEIETLTKAQNVSSNEPQPTNNESVCESSGETSDVGSSGSGPCPSDPSSQGC